jgi:hypothetical protein
MRSYPCIPACIALCDMYLQIYAYFVWGKKKNNR